MNTINPQESSFAFRLGEYDCYRTKTGKCSLLLTEEEYREAKAHELNKTEPTKEGLVDYCRLFSQHLIEKDIFNKGEFGLGIHAEQYKCGHIAFIDGQHRTCIAKQLGITSVKLAQFSSTDEYDCTVCARESRKTSNKSSFLLKILKSLQLKKEVLPGRPFEFIDDHEYPR